MTGFRAAGSVASGRGSLVLLFLFLVVVLLAVAVVGARDSSREQFNSFIPDGSGLQQQRARPPQTWKCRREAQIGYGVKSVSTEAAARLHSNARAIRSSEWLRVASFNSKRFFRFKWHDNRTRRRFSHTRHAAATTLFIFIRTARSKPITAKLFKLPRSPPLASDCAKAVGRPRCATLTSGTLMKPAT